jgi:ketosteroid isomerase-like protein
MLLDPASVLAAINDAWLRAAPDDIESRIAEHFTSDVVFVAPNLARVAKGRAAVAASYADFVRNAKILDVHLDDPVVDESGDVAVATMSWTMRYEIEGRQNSESGYDTYVFRRENDRWRIFWRSMISRSASVPSAS